MGDVVGSKWSLGGDGVEIVVAHQDDHPAFRQGFLERFHFSQELLLVKFSDTQMVGVVLVEILDAGQLGVALAALGVHQVTEQHEAVTVVFQGALGRSAVAVRQAALAQYATQVEGLRMDVTDYDELQQTPPRKLDRLAGPRSAAAGACLEYRQGIDRCAVHPYLEVQVGAGNVAGGADPGRSEEHTSELQSRGHL